MTRYKFVTLMTLQIHYVFQVVLQLLLMGTYLFFNTLLSLQV